MSVAEIKAELPKLTAKELVELEIALELAKSAVRPPVTPADYFGCLRGTVTFKPGWDEDEPLEMWEALRDDPSP
jgi:hypothetical protein